MLLVGCPGTGKDTADTAGCDLACTSPAYRQEDFQNAEKEQACVWLDGDACETVVSVQLCLDSTCFPAEDVMQDGWQSRIDGNLLPPYGDGQFCVDNDKEHLYRFTILYCADTE